MNVITIARQFGSGGRELGKRLSDLLGYDYYDREIITAISEKEGMNETYVKNVLESQAWSTVPLNFHHSFAVSTVMNEPQTRLLSAQREVIESIASAGRDCIIVGRNADLILAEYRPFRIFVCAEEGARVRRCQARAAEGENLTARAIRQNMRRIDKNRAKSREFLSETRWGDPASYDLTVNTTDLSVKNVAESVAAFWRVRQEA